MFRHTSKIYLCYCHLMSCITLKIAPYFNHLLINRRKKHTHKNCLCTSEWFWIYRFFRGARPMRFISIRIWSRIRRRCLLVEIAVVAIPETNERKKNVYEKNCCEYNIILIKMHSKCTRILIARTKWIYNRKMLQWFAWKPKSNQWTSQFKTEN